MKLLTCAVFACISLAVVAPRASSRTGLSARPGTQQFETPPTFEAVWQAHGGAGTFAKLRSYELEFDRITWVSPSDFFERQARLAVDGDRFVRVLRDAELTRIDSSIFDGSGRLEERIRRSDDDDDDDDGSLSRERPADKDRAQALTFSTQICSLIPILRMCAQPETEITFVQRTPMLLDEFRVRSLDAEFTVYADQSHLIRRVDIRRATLHFAGYGTNEGDSAKMPRLERVSIGDRLVYEFVFTRMDLKPRV